MHSNARRLTLARYALLLPLVASAVSPQEPAPQSQPGTAAALDSQPVSAGAIEIVRDNRGVPHVFAATRNELLRGLGYATAQDRLLQLELVRRQMRGRLSEVLGSPFVLLDKRARWIGFARHADTLLERIGDPELKAALEAYCGGINEYVRSLGDKLPQHYAESGIREFEDWTPADCFLVWYRLQDLLDHGWERANMPKAAGDYGGDFVDVGGAVIRKAGAAGGADSKPASQPDSRPASTPAAPDSGDKSGAQSTDGTHGTLRMSNAWVVSGARTTTGKTVLMSDPHIDIGAPSLWYEAHLKGAGIDCRGMGLPGCPGFLVGWNTQIAWGVTALPSDASRVYELAVSAESPEQYLLDGKLQTMQDVRVEEIRVKGAASVKVRCAQTVWGPLVTGYLREILQVSTDSELALKHSIFEDGASHTVQALLPLMSANNWESARSALRKWRGPALHWIYGDAAGHIGYTALANLPLVDSEVTRVRKSLDGSTTQNNWRGRVPFDAFPTVFDPPEGFISTANNLAIDPADAPDGRLIGDHGDTSRSWRLREYLGARLAKPGSRISPAEILELHRDSVEPCLRVFAKLALALRDRGAFEAGTPAAQAAEGLSHWNDNLPPAQHWSVLLSNPHYPLLNALEPMVNGTFTRGLRGGGLFVGGDVGACRFFREAESQIEQLAARDDVRQIVAQMLAQGWEVATSRGYGLLQNRVRAQRAAGMQHVLEYQENLFHLFGGSKHTDENWALFPRYNLKPESPLSCVLITTVWSQTGNSYSQFVDFGDLQNSMSLLPPGVSEDPASPFFKNQMTAWIAGTLLPAPLSESLVRARAASVKQLSR